MCACSVDKSFFSRQHSDGLLFPLYQTNIKVPKAAKGRRWILILFHHRSRSHGRGIRCLGKILPFVFYQRLPMILHMWEERGRAHQTKTVHSLPIIVGSSSRYDRWIVPTLYVCTVRSKSIPFNNRIIQL